MSADVVEYDEDTTSINNMTLRDWRHHQTRDPIIEPFLRTLTQGRRPSIQTIPHSSEAMSLYREFDHLKLHRGVLHHSTVVNGKDKLQLVLPAKFRETALRGFTMTLDTWVGTLTLLVLLAINGKECGGVDKNVIDVYIRKVRLISEHHLSTLQQINLLK